MAGYICMGGNKGRRLLRWGKGGEESIKERISGEMRVQ